VSRTAFYIIKRLLSAGQFMKETKGERHVGGTEKKIKKRM